MTLFKFVTSRKKREEDTTRGHLLGTTVRCRGRVYGLTPEVCQEGSAGRHTKEGEKDTGPMMTSERVKLPVTVPANWSDYTVLSLSAYYLCIATHHHIYKYANQIKKPYGNRTIYFNIISKGRSIWYCPTATFSLLSFSIKIYVTIFFRLICTSYII